jgi:beta-glucosidase
MIGTLQIGDKPPLTIRNGFNPGVAPVFEPVELEADKRYPFTYSMLVPILHFAELDWQRISPKPEADVADAARDADVVVAVVGLNSTLESEESAVDLPGFKGGDRQSLDLPADQMKLLEAAQATGKPIVVVNLSGSAINLDWMKRKANAIVQAWYPGEAGGLAVGRVIAGAVNPAGRLPLTFYRDLAQLPPFEEYAMKGRTYRYFTGEPIYKFGYGLSYTRFAYSPVKVTPHGKAGGMLVESSVSNVGARAGDEVAQLYLGFPDAPGVPRVALRGFERLSLAPGENRPVRFELSPRDLSSVSPEGKTRILAGNYRVFVGGGQPGGELPGSSGSFKIGATTPLPD